MEATIAVLTAMGCSAVHLLSMGSIGLLHGTTIQTYQIPNNGPVTLRVMCNRWYYCLICPVGQKLAANNGARACRFMTRFLFGVS